MLRFSRARSQDVIVFGIVVWVRSASSRNCLGIGAGHIGRRRDALGCTGEACKIGCWIWVKETQKGKEGLLSSVEYNDSHSGMKL